MFLLQPIQIFQEKQPGGLFGVVQFRGAASLFPENVIDVLKSLLEHFSKPHLDVNYQSISNDRHSTTVIQ
jgi:hypothetical protein